MIGNKIDKIGSDKVILLDADNLLKDHSLKSRLIEYREQGKVKIELIVDNKIIDEIVYKISLDKDFDETLKYCKDYIQTLEYDKLSRNTAIDYLFKKYSISEYEMINSLKSKSKDLFE